MCCVCVCVCVCECVCVRVVCVCVCVCVNHRTEQLPLRRVEADTAAVFITAAAGGSGGQGGVQVRTGDGDDGSRFHRRHRCRAAAGGSDGGLLALCVWVRAFVCACM